MKNLLSIFSDVREVPDNQEVFTYRNSNVSVIVEVLEKVDYTDPRDAVRFNDSLRLKGIRAN